MKSGDVNIAVAPTPIEMTNEIHMPEEKTADTLLVKRDSKGQITSITKE
jgi:hypothetical protein